MSILTVDIDHPTIFQVRGQPTPDRTFLTEGIDPEIVVFPGSRAAIMETKRIHRTLNNSRGKRDQSI
jgi:hypothetical protein